MKIVVTGTRGIPGIMGGVETHCEQLFPRIARRNVDVTVIQRSFYINNIQKKWEGVKLISINAPQKKSLEAIVHTFRAINYAKKTGTDIIHIHAIGPAILIPYAKILGMKVVFTHHGSDYNRKRWGRMAKWALKFGEWAGCRYADEVIAISHSIKEFIACKYKRTDAHIIHNGVPQPVFTDNDAYFETLGIEKGNYILSVGRFVPEKNYHHLISIFTSVSHGTCKLVLAGDANLEDNYSLQLKQMAKEYGVVLPGIIKGKKLNSLLTHAKCFVLPSSHEGLPIALLEAMSYRLPVIASDIQAMREIGLDDSSYFHLGDMQELAKKLEMVINTPLHRVNYNMENYDWDIISDKTLQVYMQTVGQKK